MIEVRRIGINEKQIISEVVRIHLETFAGFFFTFVEESIDKILKVTADTFKAGDQSVSSIDKHINPFEKT